MRAGWSLWFELTCLAVASSPSACQHAAQPEKGRLGFAREASSTGQSGALGAASAPNAVSALHASTTVATVVSDLAAQSKPRVYIKNRFVFVRPRPDANADWIGYLWFGASVELASLVPTRGPGCAAYYRIEPEGYVCVDEKQATLAADDPVYRAVAPFAPQLDRASPHSYGESLGVELRSSLVGVDGEFPPLPALFHEPRRRLLPLSTVAYGEERRVSGQSWLRSADLLWLKKEQVTPYPEIVFHGVELSGDNRLPLAFFRRAGSHRYRRNNLGKFDKSSADFTLQSWVRLGSAIQTQRGERYFETAAGGDWVRESEAVLPSPRSSTPWGARVGAPDRTGRAPKNDRQSWIEVSVLGGWLIAYEGTRPVYATLISPGRGGIPQAGKDTLEIAATPLGTFPISGKLATVTMQAPGEYVHSDVPWTQNFQKPYAIHTAYWHNNWGNLQSGGCINVSPIDGKWLFAFSEPALPKGWHAVRWQSSRGAPTLLVVHE